MECIQKQRMCSGELAVLHECNNTPAQVALTSFTGSKLCVQWGFRAKYVADVGNALLVHHWHFFVTFLALRDLHEHA